MNDPIESTDPNDIRDPSERALPTDPMDSTLPTDPIESTEPREPMLRTDDSDAIESFDSGTWPTLMPSSGAILRI